MSWDEDWDEDWDDGNACPCSACCYNIGNSCHWDHDDIFMNCTICLDFDDGKLDEDDYEDDYEDENDRDIREGGEDLVDYYNNR